MFQGKKKTTNSQCLLGQRPRPDPELDSIYKGKGVDLHPVYKKTCVGLSSTFLLLTCPYIWSVHHLHFRLSINRP